MIPIRSETRGTGPAPLTWLLAAACAAVIVRLAFMPPERAEAVFTALALVPARLLATPFQASQLLTLVTSAFLHAGWIHLASNLLYLMVFGPLVESRIGWRNYLLLYLGAGCAGGLAHALTHPTSTVALVGASGAIAGVLGAHLVLAPRARITTVVPVVIFIEIASLPAAFVIALWFGLQVAWAFAPVAPGATGDSIAWFTHLGGFAFGVLFAAAFRGASAAATNSPRLARHQG